ncbi:hypothetical protein Droror1_Dr00026388 [Drosera rotundifolia]
MACTSSSLLKQLVMIWAVLACTMMAGEGSIQVCMSERDIPPNSCIPMLQRGNEKEIGDCGKSLSIIRKKELKNTSNIRPDCECWREANDNAGDELGFPLKTDALQTYLNKHTKGDQSFPYTVNGYPDCSRYN